MNLNKKSVTYVTDLKISVLKSIDYCKCYYYKDAIELMNIRISGASELNGDAAREVNRACNVKKLKNCNAAKAAQFLYETCAPYHRYGQGFICLSGMRVSAYNG